jgi:hypothetical protein
MNAIALSPSRSIFAGLDARQPLLARAGWLALALLLVCLVAMLLDPRTINGVSVWVKPQKFAASFAVWFWTLAWAWGVLEQRARDGLVARIVLWGTLIAGTFEQVWITFRAALGEPSHFAQDRLGAFMYGLMGLGALTLVILAAVLGLLVLARGDRSQPPTWRIAVGLGLLIGGIAGGITGATISVIGGPVIGGTAGDAAAWPPFFWSRDGGDLRIAHFIGIHAMQAVPALALLGAGTATVMAGALGWTALVAAAYGAALLGIALMP